MSVVKIFFSILALVAVLLSGAEPFFYDFGKRAQEEHFCEIILKLRQWPVRRCPLFFSVLSSGSSAERNHLSNLGKRVIGETFL